VDGKTTEGEGGQERDQPVRHQSEGKLVRKDAGRKKKWGKKGRGKVPITSSKKRKSERTTNIKEGKVLKNEKKTPSGSQKGTIL